MSLFSFLAGLFKKKEEVSEVGYGRSYEHSTYPDFHNYGSATKKKKDESTSSACGTGASGISSCSSGSGSSSGSSCSSGGDSGSSCGGGCGGGCGS